MQNIEISISCDVFLAKKFEKLREDRDLKLNRSYT